MARNPWTDPEIWEVSLPSKRTVMVIFTVVILCLALFGIAGA
jgi:hypothetical protein